MLLFNLLPWRQQQRQQQQRRRKLIVLLAVMVSLVSQSLWVVPDLNILWQDKQQVRHWQQQLMQVKEQHKQRQQLMQRLQHDQQGQRQQRWPYQVLLALSQVTPEAIQLKRISLAQQRMTLQGNVQGNDSLESFVAILKKRFMQSKVILRLMSEQNKRLHFTLDMML